MNLTDMILLGLQNLWRTKLRTLLTVLGVVIGIGALTSMVSFGTGMQKNITDAFRNNDMFTSITVTPKKVNIDEIASGRVEAMTEAFKQDGVPLTDSLLEVIRAIPGVELAYPNQDFPARVTLMNDSSNIQVQAMPAGIRKYKPFSELLAGTFFETDTSGCVVIREEALEKFNIRLIKKERGYTMSKEDSVKGVTMMLPDSLIGRSIRLISLSISPRKIPGALFSLMRKNPEMPFDETVTELKICGIMSSAGEFGRGFFGGGIIIPAGTAGKIPKLGFSSVYDLLAGKNKAGTYSTIHVRIKDLKRMAEVKKTLSALKVGVFSISDELEEIRRGFLIVDSVLGAIGAIALIVAGLGIINTMVVSILERTREIGIMKAIGGSDREIRMIFFVEASVIGIVGAVFGLALGWLVTRIANVIMNAQLIPAGSEPVNLFYFPIWLIFGAIAFSLLVSLAAGLYPAIRAARIDPIKALRHD